MPTKEVFSFKRGLSFTYLVFHTVSGKHVFYMIQKITDGIHAVEMSVALVYLQEHFVKSYSNLLSHKNK